jgi:mono/diheme cytochrome c family protein
MKRKTAVAVCLVAAMCGLAVAQSGSESLFNSKCANCHGTDGKGSKTTKMHVADLQSKSVQAMSDDQIFESIAKGTQHKEYPHAFLYQGMTREQVQGLVKYVRTLGKGSK